MKGPEIKYVGRGHINIHMYKWTLRLLVKRKVKDEWSYKLPLIKASSSKRVSAKMG